MSTRFGLVREHLELHNPNIRGHAVGTRASCKIFFFFNINRYEFVTKIKLILFETLANNRNTENLQMMKLVDWVGPTLKPIDLQICSHDVGLFVVGPNIKQLELCKKWGEKQKWKAHMRIDKRYFWLISTSQPKSSHNNLYGLCSWEIDNRSQITFFFFK